MPVIISQSHRLRLYVSNYVQNPKENHRFITFEKLEIANFFGIFA